MLPAHLQCPGQLLAFADERGLPWLVHHQEQTNSGRRPWVLSEDDRAKASRDLNDTIEALEALARQLPDDAEVLPPERITSAEGRRILATEPRRFSRIRLGSRRQIFVDLRVALEASVVPRAAERDGNLDGLFRQILEHPDDDAPRLVFADAISSTDPEYGEFITVQIQLRERARKGLPIEPTWSRLVAQRLEQYGDRWASGVASLVTAWEFRGGFVEYVELPAAQFASRAEAIFSVSPLRHLSLTSAGGGLDVALAHPLMQRVRVLSLDANADHTVLREAKPLEHVRIIELRGRPPNGPSLRWPKLEAVLSEDRSPRAPYDLGLY